MLAWLSKTQVLELSRYATSKKTYWIIKCSVCLASFYVTLNLFIDFDFIIGFNVSLLYGLPMHPEGRFSLMKLGITKTRTGTNQQTPGIVKMVKRQIIVLLSFFYPETNSPWFSCWFPNQVVLLVFAAVVSSKAGRYWVWVGNTASWVSPVEGNVFIGKDGTWHLWLPLLVSLNWLSLFPVGKTI